MCSTPAVSSINVQIRSLPRAAPSLIQRNRKWIMDTRGITAAPRPTLCFTCIDFVKKNFTTAIANERRGGGGRLAANDGERIREPRSRTISRYVCARETQCAHARARAREITGRRNLVGTDIAAGDAIIPSIPPQLNPIELRTCFCAITSRCH